jgi:outer membrane protein
MTHVRAGALLVLALPLLARGDEMHTLTLDEALRTAEAAQPTLRQAHASTQAAYARGDEARAPLFPQLTGFAGYERQTANSVIPPGTLTSNVGSGGLQAGATTPTISLRTYDYWGLNGLGVSQLLWDFNQTLGHWHSTVSAAQSQQATEQATRLQIILTVETSYFTARANKDLVTVARDTLQDQELHLKQIDGFVRAGSRPEIDLATARAAVANARVAFINAQNAYAVSKAQLNQAMGVEGSTHYDVANDTLPTVKDEGANIDQLVKEAVAVRPEFEALQKQIESTQYQLQSVRGGYWPTVTATTTAYYRGLSLTNEVPNWNAQQNANLDGLVAQLDGERQLVRVQVEQAALAVDADKSALESAAEALVNVQEQLRLANGRYKTGVGNIIELTDAEVAVTTAAAQKVQAEYNLATARAQLLQALGRPPNVPRAGSGS